MQTSRLNNSKMMWIRNSILFVKMNGNFTRHIWNKEKVLKLWRMRNLTLEGKIKFSKLYQCLKLRTFPPSHLCSDRNYPRTKQMQKWFTWNRNNSKIKHTTLGNKYENGGLKNADILSKIISSLIKWLYDNLSHLLFSHILQTNI